MNTQTAHTPGKLVAEMHGSEWSLVIRDGSKMDGATVAYKIYQEPEANAAHLAHCWNCHQELVEALQAIEAALTQPVQYTERSSSDILKGDCRFALKIARAALAKARGE